MAETAAIRLANDKNWTTQDPWAEGLVKEAFRRYRILTGRKEWQLWELGGVVSDFNTYANTAYRQLRKAAWLNKPLWLYRAAQAYLFAYYLTWFMLRAGGGKGEPLQRGLDDLPGIDRRYVNRLDVAISVLLKSPFPWDLKRAERCMSDALRVIGYHPEWRPSHTEGLLRCSFALVLLRRHNKRMAKDQMLLAEMIAGHLLAGISGSASRVPEVISSEQKYVAQQTGRIYRKVAELAWDLGETHTARICGSKARSLFVLTDTHNQLI